MLRRHFLQSTALLGEAQANPRPNVVLILADDLGSRDLGYLGGPMRTPNLDRLGSDGVRFTQMAACPLCSPTRAALMTGRHPIRHGLGYTVVRPWATHGLPVQERTIADYFAASGYQTAAIGKWHLGHYNVRLLPKKRGFDHFYGHVNGAIDYFTHLRDGGLDWQRNGAGLREEGYTTDLLSAEAVRWIRVRDRSRPYFLYLPFNAPHTPLQAPEELLNKYSSITDQRRRTYCAMVDCLDTAVGRVMEAVRESGPTIVVFSSDNGGPRGQGADNGPLRAGKGTVFEGGTRVASFIHATGMLKPGEFSRLASVMDWLPTLAEATGAPLNPPFPLDGVSLWPALTKGAPGPRESIFSSVQGESGPKQHAYREGSWKLVRMEEPQPREMLFHLGEDPNEQADRLKAAPEVANRLRERLTEWTRLAPRGEVSSTGVAPAGYVVPKDYATVAAQ